MFCDRCNCNYEDKGLNKMRHKTGRCAADPDRIPMEQIALTEASEDATMTNANLQPATKWLAERAGVKWQHPTDNHPSGREYWERWHDPENCWEDQLPGATGSYTSEQVGTIEGWIAKAGYRVVLSHNDSFGFIYAIIREEPAYTDTRSGDREDALTQAVIALYESEGGDVE